MVSTGRGEWACKKPAAWNFGSRGLAPEPVEISSKEEGIAKWSMGLGVQSASNSDEILATPGLISSRNRLQEKEAKSKKGRKRRLDLYPSPVG